MVTAISTNCNEIAKLQSNFISSQNTIIISPRRYGKSSLVKEAAERFIKKEKGIVFCFFDLMYIYSEEELYSKFATTILKASSNKVEEFLQLAKNALKGARVIINTGTGEPALEFGELIYLNRIKPDRLREYVQQTFRSTGKEISEEICNRIIDTVENHPYYLQQFARNIWLISGKRVTDADFFGAKQAIKSENLNFYNKILEDMTNYQVSFLKALLNNEEHIYSTGVIHTYKLGSSANIRRMYNSFTKKGIIVKEAGKTIFSDPIFKLIAGERFL